MRTIEKTVYKFDELSDEAKETAINDNRYIFHEFDWYDAVYEDAKTVGVKIERFDLDIFFIAIELYHDMYRVCDKIKEYHGDSCDTYKIAVEFQLRHDTLVEKYSDGIKTDEVHEDNYHEFDSELDELEDEFKDTIGAEYLSKLRQEYEYITSDEYISEHLIDNSYEFYEDGKVY